MANHFHKDKTIPSPDVVFVFGSNLAGRHGKGSALLAKEKFGAIYGQWQGRQGQAYAIPTKDGRSGTAPLRDVRATLPLEAIRKSVDEFIQYAREHIKTRFFVVRLGCALAAHKDADIAPMFSQATGNCSFPEEWAPYLSDIKLQSINPCPKVLRLPKNQHGRDFILGDIHGAFDTVLAGMKAVNFDKKVDRLLSVGDLIDRGAGSHRCIGFLRQPYVEAVPGNHERMLIDAWRKGQLDRDVIDALANMNYNGMRWLKDVSLEKIEEMVVAFEALPIVIEVETDRGLVGLLHADVPQGMDWQTFTAQVEAGDLYATRMALGMDLSDAFHESRQRVETGRTDGVEGVGRVFVGHTPQFGGMRRLANVFVIDSGACFGEAGKGKGHLTMVNPMMATAYLSTQQERVNPLLDLRFAGDLPKHPFTALADLPDYSCSK